MLIRQAPSIKSSEITSKSNYVSRRDIIKGSIAATGLASVSNSLAATVPSEKGARLPGIKKSPLSSKDAPNSYEDVTTYNNFYEFGTGKSDPARYSQDFIPRPWTINVTGEADKTGKFLLEDFVKPHTLEERIYRLRCVEAWSMVIPWVGIPLSDVIKQFAPTSKAKYVRFETLKDAKRMPGQRQRVLNWPYEEGLTMAEAMHPLTILAVGLYGEVLPNQNGAPLRLVVPWKYGFKSIKSIVRMDFTESRPRTSWNDAGPNEYGFYANVNPEVDHPRWSQARERRIGGGLFNDKAPTLMFNGYADQVASLYDGLDLRRNF